MVRILDVLERPFTSVTILSIGVAALAVPRIFAALIPFTGLAETASIAIAGLLITLSSLLSLGYGLRCAKDAFGELPEWSHAHHLIEDGLKSLVTIMVYILPATIISAWQYPTLDDILPALIAADPIAIIVLILALIALYLLPAALMMLNNEGIVASLNMIESSRKAWSIHYAGDWLLAACISILASAIMWPLQEYALTGTAQLILILIISSILGLFVTIWSFTIYGQVWEEID